MALRRKKASFKDAAEVTADALQSAAAIVLDVTLPY